MASRTEYDKVALYIVATDRQLATALKSACAKCRPIRKQLVLLEAALTDALVVTTVDATQQAAAQLLASERRTRRPRA